MYEQLLTQAGLSPNQAAIYEALVKSGAQPAGRLTRPTGLKRGLVYKVLDELIALHLVQKQENPNKTTVFEPAHPSKLKEYVEQREKSIQEAQNALAGVLPSIISDFNLVSGRPGVQVYEGVDAVRRIAEDSLTATDEILTYIDNEAVNKYHPDINNYVVERRTKNQTRKRMITADTPYIRERAKQFNPETTDVRVIPYTREPFSTVMQIYDTKVSYLSLDPNTTLGVIIDNPFMAKMHRTLFEYTWSTAKKIQVGSQPISTQPLPPQ